MGDKLALVTGASSGIENMTLLWLRMGTVESVKAAMHEKMAKPNRQVAIEL